MTHVCGRVTAPPSGRGDYEASEVGKRVSKQVGVDGWVKETLTQSPDPEPQCLSGPDPVVFVV